MQVMIDMSLIISVLAVMATVISYITAANKIRFEVNLLKEQNKEQFEKINEHARAITDIQNKEGICRSETEQKYKMFEEVYKGVGEKVTRNEKRLEDIERTGSGLTQNLEKRVSMLEEDMKEIKKSLEKQELEITEIKMIVKNIAENTAQKRRTRE